jgi:hypothetical protein
MKLSVFHKYWRFRGGLRLGAILLSVSVAGFLAGCGGKSASTSSGNSGGSGNNGGGGTTPTGLGTWAWESGSKTANGNGSYGTLGTAASGNVPGGRLIAGGWTDSSGNFWLFGGEGYDSTGTEDGDAALNDLWKFSPSSGQWTWMGGSKTANQTGTYGTKGTAAAGNIPGARSGPTTWTDASGNFWLFGGDGYDSQGNSGYLNDMWMYSPSTGDWTWVGGSDVNGGAGQFGTLGTAAATNIPSARKHALSWVDASGNLWLFGGLGCDSTDSCGNFLNDLWKFNPGTGQWAWMSGSNFGGEDGTYGTKGTAAAGNAPGARNVAVGWTDPSGNLWMFGGTGADATGSEDGDAYLNDLWKYSVSTGQWTWVSGSSTGGQSGSYGTEGTAASGNVPASRWGSFTWVDSSGNLWFFGGYGDAGEFNDVWEFSPSSGEWTWQDGEDSANNDGAYGTEGTASASNLPGGRERGEMWKDSSGNVWIFGGEGYDSVGTGAGTGYMNDLWKYQP